MKVSVDIESDDHRVEPISRQAEEEYEEQVQEMLMNGEMELGNGDEDYELTDDDIEYAQMFGLDIDEPNYDETDYAELFGSEIETQPKPEKQFYVYQTAPKWIKNTIDWIISFYEDMLIFNNDIRDGDYTITTSEEQPYPNIKFDVVVHQSSIKFLKFHCDLWECSKNV